MFTSLAKGCLWHSVFPEWWLCRFCFQGTLKTGVAGSSEKLAAIYQITWYYSRTPLILMMVIWIGLALWGKHFRTVIVLHLFVAEICLPVVNTSKELCIYVLFACKWIWNLKQLLVEVVGISSVHTIYCLIDLYAGYVFRLTWAIIRPLPFLAVNGM
jgi:hypothetical protein